LDILKKQMVPFLMIAVAMIYIIVIGLTS